MWAVILYILLRSLGHVRITDAEIRVIRAFDPYSTAYVLLRIVNAIVPVVLRVSAYALFPMILLWIAAATVGRGATLKALLGDGTAIRWNALAGVNVLRVLALLLAALAFVGSSVLVGRLFRGQPDLIGVAILLSLGIDLLIGCVWSMLNWFLTLAPIFIVRDGVGIFDAFSASLGLFHERSGPYMGVAVLLGLVRLALIVIVSVASIIPLGMIGNFPARGIIAVSVVLALVYWVLMDAVQIWRIAAYVSLAQYEPEPPVMERPVLDPVVPGPDVNAAESPQNPGTSF